MIQISTALANSSTVSLFVKQMPAHFNYAMEDAVNETAKILRAEAKKVTPKEWDAKKEAARDAKIKKASHSSGQMAAELYLGGKKTSLWKFSSVSPRGIMAGKTSGGVTVNIAGKAHTFKHAFVTNMGRSNIGVYERIVGKKIQTKKGEREATRSLSTASFASMAKSKKTKAESILQARAQEVFEQEFIKQCDLRLASLGAK